MGVVRSTTIDTPDSLVSARATANTTGSCGAGVIPSGVSDSAPAAGCWIGTLGAVVSKLLAVGALGVGVEGQAALSSIGGGEGSHPLTDKEWGLGTGDRDDYGRSCLTSAGVVRGEPPGLLCEGKPSVEGSEFCRDSG